MKETQQRRILVSFPYFGIFPQKGALLRGETVKYNV